MTGNTIKSFYSFILVILITLSSLSVYAEAFNTGTDSVVVKSVKVYGNNTTKYSYIIRELEFFVDSTYTIDELDILIEKSQRNLINTSLFLTSSVEIKSKRSANEMHFEIFLQERWYTWPEPVLENAERNLNAWWENKDFSRLNYGLELTRYNFRGRNEQIILLLRLGYDEQYEIYYENPFMTKRKRWGFGIGAGFAGNHEVVVRSFENKPEYYKDESYLSRKFFSYFQLTYRPDIHNTNYFKVFLVHNRFDSLLLDLNPDYSFNSDGSFYMPGFQYFLKIDHRDYKSYPLNGFYADLDVVNHGIFNKSYKSLMTLRANYRVFRNLKKRWYYAAGLNVKLSNRNDPPYYLNRGLGYHRDIIRGYEYYIIDGPHFGLLKSNFKYALIPQKNKDLGFEKLKKFRYFHYALYLNLFADAAYVKGYKVNGNSLVNTPLASVGIGLDFVTYYDRVLRLETSINHLKEPGLYIHFIAPI